MYDSVIVGAFAADLVVNRLVIVELKAARAIDEIHQAQLLNYRKATGWIDPQLWNSQSGNQTDGAVIRLEPQMNADEH